MARTRHGRQRSFASIPNATIDDAEHLDFMALGLLTVLLRQKDGWDMTLERVGKKYGYGREALANAMGLLQVARYVVKVRVQIGGGGHWFTEIVTYDTPASDEEVSELLMAMAAEPLVMDVRLIEPTKTAQNRAKARATKLMNNESGTSKVVVDLGSRSAPPSAGKPALGDDPDAARVDEEESQVDAECRVTRQSAEAALSKKTVLEEDISSQNCEPSGGASGEEEEISLLDDLGFASETPENQAVCPPARLAVVPPPQESDGTENGAQRPAQFPAVCRECWQPFARTQGALVRLCEKCR